MKYTVAYLNYFDNELKLWTIESTSCKDAMISVLKMEGNDWPEIENMSEEQIKTICFDMDIAINAIQV